MPTRYEEALKFLIGRHCQVALGLVEDMRHLLDRIERDLKAGRPPSVSNTHLLTELFNRVGQYDALLGALDMLPEKKPVDS